MSVRIVTGDWNDVREDAQRLRVEVFVIEQGVPIELEGMRATRSVSMRSPMTKPDRRSRPVACCPMAILAAWQCDSRLAAMA
jgi:hypothetical protein